MRLDKLVSHIVGSRVNVYQGHFDMSGTLFMFSYQFAAETNKGSFQIALGKVDAEKKNGITDEGFSYTLIAFKGTNQSVLTKSLRNAAKAILSALPLTLNPPTPKSKGSKK